MSMLKEIWNMLQLWWLELFCLWQKMDIHVKLEKWKNLTPLCILAPCETPQNKG